jgi:two-component system response regulator NreC
MDYYMPKLNGAQAASVITRKIPGTKVLMISMNESTEFIMNAIQAGVLGIIPKDSTEKEVLEAIRDVGNGRYYIHEKVTGPAMDCMSRNLRKKDVRKHSACDLLTDRELEIIELLVKGMPQHEIITRLSVSKRTLDTHKTHIFRKLHVHSAAELIRYAVRCKLVPY